MEAGMPSDSALSKPQGAKWTVMVFMGAATIDGNAPLIEAAEADLAEMAFVGSGDALNIFVQVHRGKDVVPQRAHIFEGMPAGVDALDYVPQKEREPARGLALMSFIKWALKEAQHNPNNPQHYSLLVLWGHAYDFAFGRELTSEGIIDALDFAELSRLLESLQLELGAPGAKLDILGFDACDIATVEIACQLDRFAKYLLGSEIGIPLPGWPYDRILDRLRYPKGDLVGPAEFGAYAVRRFCESYKAESRTVSLTLLNLDCASDIFARAEVLALMLASAIGDADVRDRIADLFSQSQTATGKPFVDVADLCLNLMRSSGDSLISEAARDLGDFLISPRGPLVGRTNEPEVRPFIIEHGRNAAETARLNGVSLYAPNVAPNRDFNSVQHLYHNFVFAQETRWSGLVHALARSI
jgi:Clostripain family